MSESSLASRPDPAETESGTAEGPTAQSDPTHVGRYLVRSRLGEGSMGIVLLAYDPQLDRDVALKMLRRHRIKRSRAVPPEARILREAQAMALLNHPNVLPVYDVETVDRGIVIAMQYVEGRTLDVWLGERRRSWQEIVGVFCDAALGLQAAHDAGMTHRDFKPSNVWIGHDERVRVMDFGLARIDGPQATPDVESIDNVSFEQTRAGSILGTPFFMAPEQHAGQVVGPAADQYALCVALYEGLYDQLPFESDELRTLHRAKNAGPPARPRGAHDVPPWIHRVLERGLAPDPDRRFPSVAALRRHLQPSRSRAHWAWFSGALASVGLGLAAWIGTQVDDQGACDAGADKLAGVWDGTTKAQLRARFERSDPEHGNANWVALAARTDAWATAWVEARDEACAATVIREAVTVETMEERMRCLDRRRGALADAIAAWRTGDASARGELAAIARSLPAPAGCLDSARSDAPPPAIAEAVARLRRELDDERARWAAGLRDDAKARSVALVERARKLGYGPVLARALMLMGETHATRGSEATAMAAFEEAHVVANVHGVEDVQIGALDRLIFAAVRAGDLDAAEIAARRAEAWHDRMSSPPLARTSTELQLAWLAHDRGDLQQALKIAEAAFAVQQQRDPFASETIEAADVLGKLLYRAGSFERSLKLAERVLEAKLEAHGDGHIEIARALDERGTILRDMGRIADARLDYEAALAIYETTLGPNHVTTADAIQRLSTVAYREGKFDESLSLQRRAIEIWERANAAGSVLSSAYSHVAAQLMQLDRLEEAEAAGLRAVALAEEAKGYDHRLTGFALINLAAVYRAMGRVDDARERLIRAIAIVENASGHHAPPLVPALSALGSIEARLGRYRSALERFERVRDIVRTNNGGDNEQSAESIASMADCHLNLGDPQSALELSREALAIFEEHASSGSGPTVDRALAKFVLARASLRLGEPRPDALREARAAAEIYRAAGWTGAEATVRRWIRSPREPGED
jgi:tetratricopeptide (TPR) repeat protein